MGKTTIQEKEKRLHTILLLKAEGKSLREIGRIVGLSGERVRSIIAKHERQQEFVKHWASELSVKAYNCLKLVNCKNRREVVAMIEDGRISVENIPGLGVRTMEEIVKWAGVDTREHSVKLSKSETAIKKYINGVLDSLKKRTGCHLFSVEIRMSSDKQSVEEVIITIDNE